MADDSKTEKATPKKRRDERKEGNVFKSTDVVNVVFILVGFYTLKFLFPLMYERITYFLGRCMDRIAEADTLTLEVLAGLRNELLSVLLVTLLPFVLICAAVGIIMNGVQTKFLFATKVLKPKLEKINPIKGIRKLFSLQKVVELIKNLIKISILIVVVYFLLSEFLYEIVKMYDMDIKNSVAFVFEMMMTIVLRVTIAFVAVAIFDYIYQRWEYEKKLKMSKQEIKEEFKQTEGNPEIKGRVKNLQRQMSRNRMIQAVPEADVIIRNPTHFAVALKYDTSKNSAPVVIAKGQDELALRIIAVAEEHKVVVVENVPLARGLYKTTELNRQIPEEYYGLVAEVLVYVYKLKNKGV